MLTYSQAPRRSISQERRKRHEEERYHDDGYGDAHVQHVHVSSRSSPTAFLKPDRKPKLGNDQVNEQRKVVGLTAAFLLQRRKCDANPVHQANVSADTGYEKKRRYGGAPRNDPVNNKSIQN